MNDIDMHVLGSVLLLLYFCLLGIKVYMHDFLIYRYSVFKCKPFS